MEEVEGNKEDIRESMDVKRYAVDDFVHTAKCLKEIEVKDGQYVKYSDHKAVVETEKEKGYNEGFNTTVDNYEFTIETMQNKIEELEKLNISMRNCENCKIMQEARANKKNT